MIDGTVKYISKILNCGPIIGTDSSEERGRADTSLEMLSESRE